MPLHRLTQIVMGVPMFHQPALEDALADHGLSGAAAISDDLPALIGDPAVSGLARS